jgi:hypothetical protein
MLFPLYVIEKLDPYKINRRGLLSSGETCIKGILFVGDFGVTLDMPNKQLILRAIPSRGATFEKAIEEQDGKLCLFAQYQAELFWMLRIEKEHLSKIMIDDTEYSQVILPLEQCVVGRL